MQFVWNGVHKDFSSAVQDANALPNATFYTISWLQRQARLAHKSYIDFGLGNNEDPPRPTSLLKILPRFGTDLIIDFGGGSGWVYPILKQYGLHPSRYVVVDLPEVVNFFCLNPTEGVEYYSFGEQIPDVEAFSNRVMYSNSAIQYSADNQVLIQYLETYCPTTLIMDEVLWSTTLSDWFSVQVNMEHKVAVRFVSVQKLTDQVQATGLTLVSSWRFGISHREYTFPTMENLPVQQRIDHGKSLLFKRLGVAEF